MASGPEQVAADGRDVAEDADTEHDHHAGGELPAHPELVAQVHDERGDEHVGDERDDELLVVEDAVEFRAYSAEDRVQRGDHGDGQVRLEGHRYGRLEYEPE